MISQTTEAGEAIEALVERFDPDVIDVPGGSARVRLEAGDEAWDARIASGAIPARPGTMARSRSPQRPAGETAAFQRSRPWPRSACCGASVGYQSGFAMTSARKAKKGAATSRTSRSPERSR